MADVTRCQFVFDPKFLHTSCGWDTKVHIVTNFKLKRLTSLIGIALLSGLGSIQAGLDVMDYPLGLSNKVWSNDRLVARLNLVQRCTTSATVKCFEQCHLETLLITVVVRELSQWKAFVLIVWHTSSEHIFKNLVHLSIWPLIYE
jgi:hypothetical protein